MIVNYQSGHFLSECLGTIPRAVGDLMADIIVIDNASTDGSDRGIEPLVTKIVRNRTNVGYGKACNQALALTGAPFLCFLNPDALPRPGSIAVLVDAARRFDETGGIGPRILNPDGSIQPSCRIVPSLKVALGHAFLGMFWRSNPFSRAYKLLDWDHETEREVDWISGAAFIARREAYEQVGGFDERFFMYVEDVDLFERMRSAGWKVLYYPQSEMVHHIGGSTRTSPYRMIGHHHRSVMAYNYRKARGTLRMLLLPFIALGLAVRTMLSWIDFFVRDRHSTK